MKKLLASACLLVVASASFAGNDCNSKNATADGRAIYTGWAKDMPLSLRNKNMAQCRIDVFYVKCKVKDCFKNLLNFSGTNDETSSAKWVYYNDLWFMSDKTRELRNDELKKLTKENKYIRICPQNYNMDKGCTFDKWEVINK